MSSQDKTLQDPALRAVTVLSDKAPGHRTLHSEVIIDTVATQPGEGPRTSKTVDAEKLV